MVAAATGTKGVSPDDFMPEMLRPKKHKRTMPLREFYKEFVASSSLNVKNNHDEFKEGFEKPSTDGKRDNDDTSNNEKEKNVFHAGILTI